MARKKYTDPCRRRAQPAQNVLPMDIEVIELFDDYLHDGKGVKAMHLLYDTAFSVDFAEGIEVPEDIIPHVQELEIFEQPDDIIHDEEDLGAAGLAVDMSFESDESLEFRDRLSSNKEANGRAMTIVIAGGTIKFIIKI